MISKKMAEALNEQINAELRSAYLYLAMSLDADSKSLGGVANWFYVQWLEEQDHARIFQKYMLDQNAMVELKSIGSVPTTWKSPLAMFKDALEHEKKVTALIKELVQISFKEYDLETLSRLQWFIDEQVEEEASVREQIDAFSRIEGRPEMVGQLDAHLFSRTYKPATALND